MPCELRSKNIREGLYEYHLRIHLKGSAREILQGQKFVDCGRYLYLLISYDKKIHSLEDVEKIRDELLEEYEKLGFRGRQGRTTGAKNKRHNIYVNSKYL